MSNTSTTGEYSITGATLFNFLFFPHLCDEFKDVYNYISSDDNTFRLQHMDDFVDFLQSKANFNIDDQDVLTSRILSSTSKSRRATYIIGEVAAYPETELSDDFNDISDSIFSIQNSLADAFGDKTLADVVDDFAQTLYMEDFKRYFAEMNSSLESMSVDFGETLGFLSVEFTELKTADDSLNTIAFLEADISSKNEMLSYENYDKFLIKELKVPKNKLYIVDITRGKYEKDEFDNEMVGVMPVVVSPANAIFYQELIRQSNGILSTYNVLSKVRNSYRQNSQGAFECVSKPVDQTNTTIEFYNSEISSRQFVGIGDYLGGEPDVTINDFTVSQNAAEKFPAIKYNNGRLDRQYLGQIGIVVMKVYKNAANENKLSFLPVEAFVGSLDRWAKDATTGEPVFLDDIVNNNSDYINVFSNANIQETITHDPLNLKNTSIYAIHNQTACSMGFFEIDTRKNIHVTESIYKPMLKIFERNEDRNTLDIDILIDAGVSNIAQFIASTQLYRRDVQTNEKIHEYYIKDEFQRYGIFDFDDESAHLFKLDNQRQSNVWRKVITRFDEFVKNTRKDMIFLADGPRPFCLDGNSKMIRRSKPENTVKNTILPKLKYVANVINSSYSAGYLDWFWSLDHSTGEYMWMPPSIKACGVYLYTDNMGAYWDAPAGLNRGVIRNTLDIAFNPSNEEAGQIYINSWNYAVSYPLDGIVLEGQKTFQKEKTALDRVNVRRLMLGLEKTIRNFCKYFNYEGNTEFNRTRIKDTIDRYLEQVRINYGISQYITVCDSRNNTAQTIDNNELHIAIAVRPIKTIEFIVLNFIATNQSVDVEEAMAAELGN